MGILLRTGLLALWSTRSTVCTALVRAATSDEAAYLLRSDDGEEGDCTENPGRDITWQEAEDSEFLTESAVVLWSGEVLSKTGSALAGRFCTHQSADAAWAFSTALGMASAEVFGAQLMRWLYDGTKADLLLGALIASSSGSIGSGLRQSAPLLPFRSSFLARGMRASKRPKPQAGRQLS